MASSGADEQGEGGGETPSPRWENDALGFLIAPIDHDHFLDRSRREAVINARNGRLLFGAALASPTSSSPAPTCARG